MATQNTKAEMFMDEIMASDVKPSDWIYEPDNFWRMRGSGQLGGGASYNKETNCVVRFIMFDDSTLWICDRGIGTAGHPCKETGKRDCGEFTESFGRSLLSMMQ